MDTTKNTYAERMAAYGFTPEQTREASDHNLAAMRRINAVNKAGRERGTVDHKADAQNFRNA